MRSRLRRPSAGVAASTAVLFGLVFALAACAAEDEEPVAITVSAASSLTDVFTELIEAFERDHEGTVSLNTGASSALAVQIVEGAPVHVFASANPEQMQVVVDAGRAEDPVVFTTNEIVVVTPAGNDVVRGFEDLQADGVRLVLAGPEVPIGAYARSAITAANEPLGGAFEGRVLANVVSEESNVRNVLAKVELGEADAGIVYATDAAVAGDAVQAYAIPPEFAEPAQYVIAPLADAPRLAREFVEFVLSEEGQAILDRHGFTPREG